MAKGDPFYMRAKYSGRCGTCNGSIRAGDQVVYAPNGKRVFCTKTQTKSGCGDEIMRNLIGTLSARGKDD